MVTHDIVAIGASAGGIEALKRLVSMLPKDLPAAILVVQHLHPEAKSVLDQILTRAGSIPATFAIDGETIKPSHIYIAPPDCQMLAESGRLRVLHGPRENRHRPAVDPLFRSAAWGYGPRVVGVVLSGTLDDGAAGLWAIRQCGGVTVVQDPDDAKYSEMPMSALMTLDVDHVAPLENIAKLLERLATEPVDTSRPAPRPESIEEENRAVQRSSEPNVEDMPKLGKPAGFTCPTCHGSLWELDEGELVVYRCHIGHAFGPDSLMTEGSEDVEHALEVALRAIEEQIAAAQRLGTRLGQRVPAIAQRYERQAAELGKNAGVLRTMLQNGMRRNG